MLREIRVYGQLAKFLGRRTFKAAVSNAAEAFRFLLANFPQLEKHMAEQRYRVSVGDYNISLGELYDPTGRQTIKIIPVIGGASGDPLGDILIGAAIIGSLFIPGATAFLGTALTGIAITTGAALILGGVSQLLTPTESLSPIGLDTDTGGTEGTVLDPQESYSFNGIQNVSRPGLPVPICYGEILVGSIVISTGTDTIAEEV